MAAMDVAMAWTHNGLDDVRSNTRRRSRIVTLATPKHSKATYWTSFGPTLVWGNQDPMWPLSRHALAARLSPRLLQLSQHKINYQDLSKHIPEYVYSCGRSSSLWHVSPAAAKGKSSTRVIQLAQPKVDHSDETKHIPQSIFSCGRSSPIWEVTEPARNCVDREHTLRLSQPKPFHRDYIPNRDVQWPVSKAAQEAIPRSYTESLAKAKERQEGPVRDPEWRVSRGAMVASPTSRVVELSKPKGFVEGYVSCRDVAWPVHPAAKRAVASERLGELAMPVVRETMDHVQFNPDAFTVSAAAKKAKCSDRVAELAQPITRDV